LVVSSPVALAGAFSEKEKMNSRIETEEIALSERQILLIQARAALLREERRRIALELDREGESEYKKPPERWLALFPLAAFVLLLGVISSALWW
jgi:hypothetical protein